MVVGWEYWPPLELSLISLISIKMSFNIRIDTEKGHIDNCKVYIATDKECSI